MRRISTVAIICTFLLCGPRVVADEGGAGHYLPGSISDLADGVPLQPTFVVRYNQIYYTGSASATKAFPIVGVTALGLHATTWGEGITLIWRPKLNLGKRWSYAMVGTIPFLQMSVNAKTISPPLVGLNGSLNGLGDVMIIPAMVNYNIRPSLNVNFRVAEYLPTGDYSTGRLANTGKNFWTTEPTFGIQYLGPKNGHEAALFAGFDFNTENNATRYHSGTDFHLDGTLAQHISLWKGLAGFGVNAFYYQQISDDGGSGANLGAFRGTTTGLGPVVSYDKKTDHVEILADLKWLNEVYTQNRVQGNTVFLKVLFKF